jgi:hypothetical protein
VLQPAQGHPSVYQAFQDGACCVRREVEVDWHANGNTSGQLTDDPTSRRHLKLLKRCGNGWAEVDPALRPQTIDCGRFCFDRRPTRAEGREMKKQILKGLTMLVIIMTMAFLTAVISANAQTRGGNLRADVPFDFIVGDKTMAAGQYGVSQIT